MKNIIIYKSHFDIIESLTDEQAGLLIKSIGLLSQDKETQITDPLVLGIFMGIRRDFETQFKNYDNKVMANRENGKLGGRPKKVIETHDNPNNPNGYLITHDNPQNLKDKDKDKDKEKEKDKEKDKEKVEVQLVNKFINYAILDSDSSLKKFYVENKNDIEFLITQGYTLEQSLSIHEDAIKCSIFK